MPPASQYSSPGPQSSETLGVAVVITSYNHATFLPEAIESVLNQTVRVAEIIVVDDGSADEPETVVRRYSGVTFIRQENRGLAAARNTGLRRATAEFVAFLDADDVLFPTGIETGWAHLSQHPEALFTYGAHRMVDAERNVLSQVFRAVEPDALCQLLRGNFIGMHGTVLYRRNAITEAGGFDERLRLSEDYDLYLRLAAAGPIVSHPDVVADYRQHGSNLSSDTDAMLRATISVLDRWDQFPAGSREAAAQAAGRANWRRYFLERTLKLSLRAYKSGQFGLGLRKLGYAVRMQPATAFFLVIRQSLRAAARRLPRWASHIAVRLRLVRRPPVGKVALGDLRYTAPISDHFGLDRGTPVDRYYIDNFMRGNANRIVGRVLEIGDDHYSALYGKVTRQDILHIHRGSSLATIVGDLSQKGCLPDEAFDCVIVPQTLHLIFDWRAALEQIYASLRPGGSCLLTVPGISQVDRYEWRSTWYWSMTPVAAMRMFSEVFGRSQVTISSYGNVLAATAFLQGIASEELDPRLLADRDDAYPVIVGVVATRPGNASHDHGKNEAQADGALAT